MYFIVDLYFMLEFDLLKFKRLICGHDKNGTD